MKLLNGKLGLGAGARRRAEKARIESEFIDLCEQVLDGCENIGMTLPLNDPKERLCLAKIVDVAAQPVRWTNIIFCYEDLGTEHRDSVMGMVRAAADDLLAKRRVSH